MVPFDVKVGGKRVGISFESLIWFFIVTAGATVVGELVYQKWVLPYLNKLPNLPGISPTLVQLPPANVVSTQTPKSMLSSGMMNPTNNPGLPS